LVAVVLAMVFTTNATAQVATYSEDFNALNEYDLSSLDANGWGIFASVTTDLGDPKFTYGPFAAPNIRKVSGSDFLHWQRTNGTAPVLASILGNYGQTAGGGFSSLVHGQGAGGVADQYLNSFSDYNCCGLNDGHPTGTDLVNTSLFQESTVAANDADMTATFSTKIKLPGGDEAAFALGGLSTAQLFVLTLNPLTGYSVSAESFVNVDTTYIPTLNDSTWVTATVDFDIAPEFTGHIFQFGIRTTASNFDPSGVFLDDISLTLTPTFGLSAGLTAVPEPSTALIAGIALLSLSLGSRRRLVS
jgi:hypothetical protein